MKIANIYCPTIPVFGTNGIKRKPLVGFMAVLTQDDTGLYAAYVGIVQTGFEGTELDKKGEETLRQSNAQLVAHSGSKLRFAEIGSYFRGIAEEQYRR